MATQIKITSGSFQIGAVLNDSVTAKAVIGALPIRAAAQRWGGEVYFTIPVSAPLEQENTDILHAGQLGYWPPGKAFCIFFGKTPASNKTEIRAASPVNVVGHITDDFSALWNVNSGDSVSIEPA
ncbi:MAG TPA: cyclophilin-like fold protein [Sedimentisphaerales bacterium]|nr:cyclophilin-like fold protein [Sedimentisphaerales bacterium]